MNQVVPGVVEQSVTEKKWVSSDQKSHMGPTQVRTGDPLQTAYTQSKYLTTRPLGH